MPPSWNDDSSDDDASPEIDATSYATWLTRLLPPALAVLEGHLTQGPPMLREHAATVVLESWTRLARSPLLGSNALDAAMHGETLNRLMGITLAQLEIAIIQAEDGMTQLAACQQIHRTWVDLIQMVQDAGPEEDDDPWDHA